MARKEKIITLTDRDHELEFRIREMPATRLERWLIRFGCALASTGFAKSFDIASGLDARQVVADMLLKDGLKSLGNLSYDKVEPLINELYTCVEQKVGNAYLKLTPELIDTKIEDIRTLGRLQLEVIKLHLDFFAPDGLLNSTPQPGQQGSDRLKQPISHQSSHR